MKITTRLPPPPHLLLCLMRVVYVGRVCIVPPLASPRLFLLAVDDVGDDVIKILGSMAYYTVPHPPPGGDYTYIRANGCSFRSDFVF